MLFKFIRGLFLSDYVIVARRFTIPPNKGPVFSTFIIREGSLYDAARHFDQNYTAWTRLSVTEKL